MPWASLVAEVAEVAGVGAFAPDTMIGELVDSCVEVEIAERDLDMSEDTRSDADRSVKAVVFAGSIGFVWYFPDRVERWSAESQDRWD